MATAREQREQWLKTRNITPKEFNGRVKDMVDKECKQAESKSLKRAKSRRALVAWKQRQINGKKKSIS